MVLQTIKKIHYQTRKKTDPFNKYYLENIYQNWEKSAKEIYDKVASETMIGPAGVLANIDAIDYLAANKIPGRLVECGVWRGGSMMAMLLRLLEKDDANRHAYLFDTYTGMTEPTEHDSRMGRLDITMKKFRDKQRDDHNDWCYGPIEDVKNNIKSTGYNENLIHYIKGDVLKTIPETPVENIALLRLDTDWYESTKLELEYFYPKVVKGGVVLIDDYGVWDGARKAVDEYFGSRSYKPLLARTDHTRRLFVKMEEG